MRSRGRKNYKSRVRGANQFLGAATPWGSTSRASQHDQMGYENNEISRVWNHFPGALKFFSEKMTSLMIKSLILFFHRNIELNFLKWNVVLRQKSSQYLHQAPCYNPVHLRAMDQYVESASLCLKSLKYKFLSTRTCECRGEFETVFVSVCDNLQHMRFLKFFASLHERGMMQNAAKISYIYIFG
jgi:hypothetical protein